jgi:hypothetical protein
VDISETLAPKSEQLDNIDLRDCGPRIFTVTAVDVRPGTDQPVTVHLAEFPRPWKPGKNMRRVLAFCWGRESDSWPGKRVELFADEKVKFGNETPGGTRISRLSGIDGPQSVPVLVTQGRADTYKVDPLPDATPAKDWDAIVATALGLTNEAEIRDLWRREGVGSAPDAVRAAITERVAAIQAAAEVSPEDAFEAQS